MENLDIIILSSIVTTLFAVFIGLTVRELSKNEQPKEEEIVAEPEVVIEQEPIEDQPKEPVYKINDVIYTINKPYN